MKTSEGFRLHKTAIKHSVNVPTITECERLCSDQNGFICHTYSYRYSNMGRDNCMLCDRTINHLDYYVDLEPDRDYDIYSMSDDMNSCRPRPPPPYHGRGGSESTAVGYPRNQARKYYLFALHNFLFNRNLSFQNVSSELLMQLDSSSQL